MHEPNDKIMVNRTKLFEVQVKNYRNGIGLLIHIHITHHAGTAFCNRFLRPHGRVPSQHCMWGNEWPKNDRKQLSRATPWQPQDVDSAVRLVRSQYHAVSWEYGHFLPLLRELRTMDWEHPRIVSVLIVRNPLDRLLAGDAYTNFLYGPLDNRTTDAWWQLANDPKYTNNYALRVLSDSQQCCQGRNTGDAMFELAKGLVGRFTFVLDQDCLDDNLVALADQLGLKRFRRRARIPPLTARERVQNETLYQYLLDRNAQDMKLYWWAKKRSLVKCTND